MPDELVIDLESPATCWSRNAGHAWVLAKQGWLHVLCPRRMADEGTEHALQTELGDLEARRADADSTASPGYTGLIYPYRRLL